ncbi:alginate lyase family protein [Haloarcula salina]|uniref:Heparinase II/III family protein n=1 Tax=Haloarcula salina TaxID=1429914 RepID=A0AA41G1Z5_9EURY|nr:alginate lyase family protein [Haloarcula salina]MBV0902730.1 heparinase II/III family protein [Haloarcula salina]
MSESDTSLWAFADAGRSPLLYHTARNMQSRQILGIAERKLRHLVVPSIPIDFDARYESAIPEPLSVRSEPIAANTATLRGCLSPTARMRFRRLTDGLGAGEVTFRNRTVAVDGPRGVDWLGESVPSPSTLWGVQFYGLTFLVWPVLGYGAVDSCRPIAETLRDWIDDWSTADGTEIGRAAYLRRVWTPHTVSLRVIHLVRYYAWAVDDHGTEHARLLRRLIYKNAGFLSNHVEHDVGGNHLIENGAALALAGLFFEADGSGFLRQGVDVLQTAAAQFLADGGHFELSPMYHVITLTRYLTVCDLLERTGREVPRDLWRTTAAAARHLDALRPPDGRLPLLNDAAFGMALPMDACLDYARSVGIDIDASAEAEQSPLPDQNGLEASGYYWIGDGTDRLLADGGAVGPPHLPAHSHNDHFAVLWWVDGQRLLCDTGVYEYLPTDERQHARSVAAHNTVQYGALEPIPIGGSYLFGRRIEPTIRYGTDDGIAYFDGSYTRHISRDGRYRHRRRIYGGDDWWLVWDRLTASAPDRVRSRLHFDPAVRIEPDPEPDRSRVQVHRAERDSDPLAYCHPVDARSVSRSQSRYFPAFGQSVPRTCLTLHSHGEDVSLGYLLSRHSYDAVGVSSGDAASVELSLDGRTQVLPATVD